MERNVQRLHLTDTIEHLHNWTREELLIARSHGLGKIALFMSDIEAIDEELGRREYES